MQVGMTILPSKHSVKETMDRFEHLLGEKNVKVFARIDQKQEAESVGLTLRPTELLMFGNPKAGTPLMQAVPTIAIDLPLKAVAWEDDSGKVWVGYNSPEFLKQRHGLTDEQTSKLSAPNALIDLARS